MERIQPFTKKITGTGAAINVSCGFKPKFVVLLNLTQLSVSFHSDTMTAAHAVTIDDSGSNATDVLAKTSGGVTLRPQGFTIGADAMLNTASDVIHAIAF